MLFIKYLVLSKWYYIWIVETKQSNMKLFISIPLIILLFSCGNSKKVSEEIIDTSKAQTETNPTTKPPEMKPERNVKLKAFIGDVKETDAFSIESAVITGNTLLMTITYSGGCADHQFEFIGSPAIQKSMPPIRAVRLVHNANDDACRSVVTRIIEVDLQDIAYQQRAGSELMLHLEGFKTKLKYTFE